MGWLSVLVGTAAAVLLIVAMIHLVTLLWRLQGNTGNTGGIGRHLDARLDRFAGFAERTECTERVVRSVIIPWSS